MKNKRFIISIFATFLVFFTLFVNDIHASKSYTLEDVQNHNTPTDCWVIFDNKVYDITKYITKHDRYYNIREWCGTDMTEAFQTKDNIGRDHKASSYTLLESYYIGDLESNASGGKIIKSSETTDSDNSKNPYNFILPFGGTILIYLITFRLYRKNKILSISKFNSLWNSLLLLSLIPSAMFGFFLIFRYSITSLNNIHFDFLYWHVEGSIVFATICGLHFIQRIKQYLIQTKTLFHKNKKK